MEAADRGNRAEEVSAAVDAHAIAPPAAITNAMNDALKGLGVELLVSPVTPRRVLEAIKAGRGG